jgi:cytochrome b pre-mRNA-processing protein 3
MIFPRFRRKAQTDTISTLYGTIVAQARLPAFYRDYAVADTVNGRFELLLLHLALFAFRAAQETGSAGELGQGVFDRFCTDMDDNLREMGVGDLKVPKEMQLLGSAYYGRLQAYHAALAADDENALGAAIARNVYDGSAPLAARRLAAYMIAGAADLARQDLAAIARGELSFPDPSDIPALSA